MSSFDEKYANWKHKLAKAFPLTMGYFPKGKEVTKLKQELWRKRLKERLQKFTGGNEDGS